MDLSASAVLLDFSQVAKAYMDSHFHPVEAIRDVSFSVGSGEFISILGPSGCGKSTVLRLAAGLEAATSGTVRYRGQDITAPDPERGFVFQAYNAFPWLTVRENIAFGLNSSNSNQQVEKVDRWMNLMGLGEFADAYPKALSGGMRQRLAIARTMIVEPKLLLLDEPFGALDERIREAMQQLLLRVVSESACTVLFVTHDIREAILLSDRVLLLSARPGRVLKSFVSPLPKPRVREHGRGEAFDALYSQIVDNFPVPRSLGETKE